MREDRRTMTLTFVGVRDGMLAAQVGGRKVFGHSGLPEYAREPQADRTGEDLFADFPHLVTPRTH